MDVLLGTKTLTDPPLCWKTFKKMPEIHSSRCHANAKWTLASGPGTPASYLLCVCLCVCLAVCKCATASVYLSIGEQIWFSIAPLCLIVAITLGGKNESVLTFQTLLAWRSLAGHRQLLFTDRLASCDGRPLSTGNFSVCHNGCHTLLP